MGKSITHLVVRNLLILTKAVQNLKSAGLTIRFPSIGCGGNGISIEVRCGDGGIMTNVGGRSLSGSGVLRERRFRAKIKISHIAMEYQYPGLSREVIGRKHLVMMDQRKQSFMISIRRVS